MDKAPSLLRNSAIMMLCRPFTAAASLLLVPIVIRYLGFEGYGTWEFFMAIAALFTMVSQTVAATVLWKVSGCFGAGDFEGLRRYVRIGSGIQCLLILLLGTLGLVLSPLILAGLRYEMPNDYSRLLPALILVLLLSSYNDLLGAVMTGCQRIGEFTVIQSIGIGVNYATTLGFMISGKGLPSLLAGYAAGALASHLLIRIASIRLLPPVTLLPSFPKPDERRDLFRYSGLYLLGQGAHILRDQTDIIVLTTLASPILAGYYGVAAKLANLVLEVNGFFYNPLVAAVGAAKTKSGWTAVKEIYKRMSRVYISVIGLFAVSLFSVRDQLIHFWIGGDTSQVSLMMAILLTGNAVAVILTASGTAVARATGKIEVESFYIVATVLLNIILTIVLVAFVGPIGTVYATSISWIASSVLFSALSWRLFGFSRQVPLESLFAVFVMLLVFGCSSAVSFHLTRLWSLPAILIGLPILASTLYFSALILGRVISPNVFSGPKALSRFSSHEIQ